MRFKFCSLISVNTIDSMPYLGRGYPRPPGIPPPSPFLCLPILPMETCTSPHVHTQVYAPNIIILCRYLMSSNGVTILRYLFSNHPVTTCLLEACILQHLDYFDGTTSLALIATQLMCVFSEIWSLRFT